MANIKDDRNKYGCLLPFYIPENADDGVDVPRCCCVNISVENVTETISCHECWNQEMKK